MILLCLRSKTMGRNMAFAPFSSGAPLWFAEDGFVDGLCVYLNQQTRRFGVPQDHIMGTWSNECAGAVWNAFLRKGKGKN